MAWGVALTGRVALLPLERALALRLTMGAGGFLVEGTAYEVCRVESDTDDGVNNSTCRLRTQWRHGSRL